MISENVMSDIWQALLEIEEENYLNGRTSCYWHIMSVLESHINDNKTTINESEG